LSSKLILFELITTDPDDGVSIKDSKFSKVDFPDPERPTIE